MEFMDPTEIENIITSLGVKIGDTINISDNCLAILEEILERLLADDCTVRTFRRTIGFGQNIRKDFIPLLLTVKDNSTIPDATKIIDTIIKILVNLTIPVEYLLSLEHLTRSEVGQQIIFELNRLLLSSKEAFTDVRSTKAVMDHIKYVVEKKPELNIEQCDSVNNCLLLLRNILHIPETKTMLLNCPLAYTTMQNQILWNLFTQSIDKIIIYLLSSPQKMYWGVTMVQLIALMYKDQHLGSLQKLLNLWLEASLSESSEDNESNTSPPNQASGDSSPMITSDPTSDSSASDNGGSGKCNDIMNNVIIKSISGNPERKCNNTSTSTTISTSTSTSTADSRSLNRINNKSFSGMKRMKSAETEISSSSGISSMGQSTESTGSGKNEDWIPEEPEQQSPTKSPSNCPPSNTNKKRNSQSSQSEEISDCGYVTQLETHESISTSSNDDEQPTKKPVHQKPHIFQKSRYKDSKGRTITALEKKELRRKKLVKRSKSNIINMKGMIYHLPTDEDISNILKEFTVDFLLKGYAPLVQDLYSELLTNIHVQVDTSHFFWLVTYFLKFATQLELDLEHIGTVLSYDVLLFLIFQGVWIHEELEIICKIPNVDLKPCLRRLHLVVTAVREFLQAINSYQKMVHLKEEDHRNLLKLQIQISKTDDLRNLFLLLLRHYNPKMQSKQYLQDLILTNHNYLMFLDNVSKTTPEPPCNMVEHLTEFATVEIMQQYGRILECFKDNGELVNNCIFTMMHHIAGDLSQVSTLFQPSILKTFAHIWETDYEICDDWSDLIEYVINKLVDTPGKTTCSDLRNYLLLHGQKMNDDLEKKFNALQMSNQENWTREEKDNLLSYYNESKYSQNAITNITKKYQAKGAGKTQSSIIEQLLQQNIISKREYQYYMQTKSKKEKDSKTLLDLFCDSKEQNIDTDIKMLKEKLFNESKGKSILWLQEVLIEACYAKLVLTNVEIFQKGDFNVEPTIYYYTLLNLPIPVVPWTAEQTEIIHNRTFILLLHKLGFYLPADTGKIFVRIPNFWTADYIFSVAQQLGPVDSGKLKFDVSLLEGFNKQEKVRGNKDKYSTVEEKRIPSIIRSNSTEWLQTILQSRVVPMMDTVVHVPSANQLSISIPTCDTICDLPPPELTIATNIDRTSITRMEYSPIQETSNNYMERNSACETLSVASDLTRMCVSDEDEKESPSTTVQVIPERFSRDI